MPHCFWHWLPPFVILRAAKNLFLRCWFSCHLLFLPAAGRQIYSQGGVNGAGSEVWLWSVSHAKAFTYWDGVWRFNSWDLSNRMSIRLASVVSEGLTQHHLLFLPAAGYRDDHRVSLSEGSWWSTSLDTAGKQVRFSIAQAYVGLNEFYRGYRAQSIRLASVVSEGLTRQGNASYIFRP